jgi:transcriptional regulator with XRE-family HTH domain
VQEAFFMEVNEVFADRLKQLREVAGLSQAALAERLGVSRGSISFYENGERIPDIVFLDKVAEFFGGVPLDYLLGYVQNKIPENIDMGLRLGLSDKAIENLSDARYDTELLSLMIEDELFEDMMNCLTRYFYASEDPWAPYIKHHDAILESDFNTSIMGEYFKSIVKSIRSKVRGAAIMEREGLDPNNPASLKIYYDRTMERIKASTDKYEKQKAETMAKMEREFVDPKFEEEREMRGRVLNFLAAQRRADEARPEDIEDE